MAIWEIYIFSLLFFSFFLFCLYGQGIFMAVHVLARLAK